MFNSPDLERKKPATTFSSVDLEVKLFGTASKPFRLATTRSISSPFGLELNAKTIRATLPICSTCSIRAVFLVRAAALV